MKSETVMAVLQRVSALRAHVDALRQLADGHGLQAGDREVIDRVVTALTGELDVLAQTLRDRVADPGETDS